MENRHGLLVDFQLTQATGTAERDVVPHLLYDAELRGFHPRTLGADKAYDARACVATMRQYSVTPHIMQNTSRRRSAIDHRTTRHPGYATSQRLRNELRRYSAGSSQSVASAGHGTADWYPKWAIFSLLSGNGGPDQPEC